jgi:ABC-type multidrug transport system fused ATPase/permease subunit
MVSATNAVWYILVYGTSSVLLLSHADWRLGIPIIIWFITYAGLMRLFVPRMRERSRRMSEVRSMLTGRVVDSYTNILTVKLFARARQEDAFIRDGVDEHTDAFRHQLRLITTWFMVQAMTNALLVTSTGAVAVELWVHGRVPVGTVAMAIPMAWQIANMAGWVAQNVTSIFENVGTVQDGMRSIAHPRQMPDRDDAVPLRLDRGAIRFENLVFDYGRGRTAPRAGRRRQVHPRQLAAAFLRPGLRPHPDRRAGYRRPHAGKPARRDRHGHAGYLAAASLDPRQYPLRTAGGDGGRDLCRRRARPCGGFHRASAGQ